MLNKLLGHKIDHTRHDTIGNVKINSISSSGSRNLSEGGGVGPMTHETCGLAWRPSFFLTSFNRGRRARASGAPLDLLLNSAPHLLNSYVLSNTYVIGIINVYFTDKYSYFSFSCILRIWWETACDTQIVS